MEDRAAYGKTPLVLRRRQQILAIARTLIVEKGIANTTMQEIAIAAEIGRKTLYRYFANMEQIAQEIMASLINSPQSFSNTIVAEGKNGREKLRNVCLAYCAYCVANPSLMLFYYEYDYHFRQPHDHGLHQAWAQRPNIFINLLEEGIADGSLELSREKVQVIGVTLPNTIIASAQRLICRETVYKLEYNYSLQDLHVVAELLIDGIKPGEGKK